MTMLGDLRAVRILAPGDSAVGSAFSRALPVSSDVAWEAVGRLADEDATNAILIIQSNVEPEALSEAIRIDPDLIATGLPIGLVSRSRVTGLHLATGAVLMPTAAVAQFEAVPRPEITLPYSVGCFVGNELPEQAFENGFLSVTNSDPSTDADRNLLAMAASLGIEALNGCWWVLGALSGLLPEQSMAEAWHRHKTMLDAPGEMARQIKAEARRVRLETGLPVVALRQQESRTIKTVLPSTPPAGAWRRFAEDCIRHDPALKPLAEQYLHAGARIWPELA